MQREHGVLLLGSCTPRGARPHRGRRERLSRARRMHSSRACSTEPPPASQDCGLRCGANASSAATSRNGAALGCGSPPRCWAWRRAAGHARRRALSAVSEGVELPAAAALRDGHAGLECRIVAPERRTVRLEVAAEGQRIIVAARPWRRQFLSIQVASGHAASLGGGATSCRSALSCGVCCDRCSRDGRVGAVDGARSRALGPADEGVQPPAATALCDSHALVESSVLAPKRRAVRPVIACEGQRVVVAPRHCCNQVLGGCTTLTTNGVFSC
mmetsp:Transcript_66553/g.206158  ORF Transcript_66553/g.206158 Transcript_66553/m.206158 type:complete len:272 (-) Transcript_66553:538-1353(-)